MMLPFYALILIILAVIVFLNEDNKTAVVNPVTYEPTPPVDQDCIDYLETMLAPEPAKVSDAELLELWDVTGNPIYYEMVFGTPPNEPGTMPKPS